MNPREPDNGFLHGTGIGRSPPVSALRLLIIPALIYVVWVLDTYLLEGSLQVFSRYQPTPLILYTVVANLFLGIGAPIICLRSAFLSGAVNMFQIGFRNVRRTIPAVAITALAGYLLIVTFTPYGSQRISLAATVALMLPVAVAEVMVCWVFVGTHLQAYLRSSGAAVSIATGVLVTGTIFALSFAAHSPAPGDFSALLPFFLAGIGSALFFFAVRDVYASAIFVALVLAVVMQGRLDPAYTGQILPVVAGCAVLSILTLAACQRYLSKRFITVQLPAKKRI